MPRNPAGKAVLETLCADRRAGAAVEFGICGVAIFGFLMVLLNLALLGLSVGTLSRATQATARAAAAASANYYEANASYDCNIATTTSYSGISTLFDHFAGNLLPASGTTGSANPLITATWYNTPSSTTNGALPPGVDLVLTVQYVWHAIGFAKLTSGITLKVTTIATVMGTTSGSPSIASDCGTSS